MNFGNFIKLYRNEADPRVPIHADSTNGILDLTPGYHDIKILVMDALKNTRVIHGTVFNMMPFDITLEPLGETEDLLSFLIQPRSITIPIKSVIAYSFTPFGYADEQISIQSSEPIEAGRIVTVPKNQSNNWH